MENNIKIMQTAYVKALAKEISKASGEACDATLEAVFENMDVLAKEVDHFGKKKKFLPLNYKKLYAFLIHPKNRIEYDTQIINDSIRVEAKMYWTPEDPFPAGVGLVTIGISQVAQDMFLTETERRNLVESTARGMAATRALSDAGIGLQFSGDIDGDETELPNSDTPATVPDTVPATTKKARKSKAAKEETSEKDKESLPSAPEETPVNETETKEMSDENIANSSSTEVNEEPNTTSIVADPSVVLADIGNYAGISLTEIYQTNPRNIVWLYKNSEKEDVREAAKSILETDENLIQYI